MRAAFALSLAFLAACAPAPSTETGTEGFARKLATPAGVPAALPPMKTFAPGPPPSGRVLSNADLTRDFLALTFELESGRQVAQFSRFEGPISVAVTGRAPATLQTDLAALIGRLRSEAGINIALVSGSGANITINAVSRAQVRRYLPEAACFVIPNVSTWTDFLRARRKGLIDWTQLTERRKLAIFLPNDVAPQEIRDCLHEELAQALGPVNDLYRLPNSVFNDDNVHTVLTSFDMLILRATYDASLQNGMTRAQVAERLPGIFARIHPQGVGLRPQGQPQGPRTWIDAVQTALGPGVPPLRRIDAARSAVRIAQAEGWTDNRRGFSHYILGRMTAGDPDTARAQFLEADRFFAASPDTRLHRAFAAAQLAADALRRDAPDQALARIEPMLPIARTSQNATLLATLMLVQAEALERLGRTDEAQAVRLDSLGWARYGFGAGDAVRDKRDEVAQLSPATQG